MNAQDILNFKIQIQNFSLKELEDMRTELVEQISKMILDNDIVTKATLVDEMISIRKEQNN